MRQTYRVLGYLIAIGVVVQAAAIALAWFTVIKDVDDGAIIDKDYDGNFGHALHGMLGMMGIPLLALLLFIVSFFAKFDGAVKWAGFTLIAVVVQVVLAFVSFGAPAIGALHGINAFVVLGLAATCARKASEPVPSEPAQPVAA